MKKTICNHTHAISYVGKISYRSANKIDKPVQWVACKCCNDVLDGIPGNKDIRVDEVGVWEANVRQLLLE